MIPHGNLMIVDQIVDRHHVHDDHMTVLRAVRRGLVPGARIGREHRDLRKSLYLYAVKAHRANRAHYAWVMGSHA